MRRCTLSLLGLAAATSLLAGCVTHQPLMVPQNPMAEAQQDGVSLSLRFLDEAQLKRRITPDENPFLTQYNRMQFRRIMVFDVMAANTGSETLEINLPECKLAFGETRRVAASTRQQIVNYWGPIDKYPKTSRAKQMNAEKYILPTLVKVRPDSQIRGYLVFQGDLPDTGAATVSVPVHAGAETIPLDFEFQF
jgi:hypothetical protein